MFAREGNSLESGWRPWIDAHEDCRGGQRLAGGDRGGVVVPSRPAAARPARAGDHRSPAPAAARRAAAGDGRRRRGGSEGGSEASQSAPTGSQEAAPARRRRSSPRPMPGNRRTWPGRIPKQRAGQFAMGDFDGAMLPETALPEAAPRTHKIVDGDTLAALAERYWARRTPPRRSSRPTATCSATRKSCPSASN